MLSEKFATKLIHESNHGGVVSSTSGLSIGERKMLLNYLLKGGKCLPSCYVCEATHTA